MTPVYICTGLLDSGKTTFIKDTLMEQEWLNPGRTLILLCEEGEFELDAEYKKSRIIETVTVEDPDVFTQEFCKNCVEKYHPGQIIIEFNGMWNLQEFLQKDFPQEWGLAGIYSTVDGSQLELLMNNMRALFMNQLIESDLVVVNRCRRDMNRTTFRKALKLQNPNAQVIFEALDGGIIEFSEEDLPYDINADVIDVEDVDYATWYADAMENPSRYRKKKIRFLAQIMRPVGMPRNMFVPGRQIMACCAADVRFYGIPCKADGNVKAEPKSWKRVTVEFSTDTKKALFGPQQGAQPVLKLIAMEDASAPEQEICTP